MEPYIKEPSSKLENTNSILIKEEMRKDKSKYVEKNKKNISFVEMKEPKETEKKEEVKETPTLEKKEKKLYSIFFSICLFFIPVLSFLLYIAFHSSVFMNNQVSFIVILLLDIFIIYAFYYLFFKEKKKHKKSFHIVHKSLLSLYLIGLALSYTLLYSPYRNFRDWLIPTAMSTMHHQYFATWFYSEKEVKDTLSENTIIESKEDTDTSLIQVGSIDFNASAFENKYEKEVLTKEEGNDIYKIIPIKGKGYKGYLVVVYDPSLITVTSTKYLNVQGEYVSDMAAREEAVLAINGGGFIDPNYNSLGGVPQGVVIQNGKIISDRYYVRAGGLVGFNKENKLVLGRYTAKEALKKGIRDAVSFGPFLIVNGVKAFISGNGGWGSAPRTAIGQRKDGIVLFLVLDGRMLKYPGADMGDLTDIMARYGAYNAANLDGGTSSNLVFKKEVAEKYLSSAELKNNCTHGYCYINEIIDGSGYHQTRWIATAFIVK